MRHILSDNRNILSFQTLLMPIDMKKFSNFLKNISERDRENSDLTNNSDISTLWLYRIMVKCEGYKFQLKQHHFHDDDLAMGLGFEDYFLSDEPKIYSPDELKIKLFKRAESIERDKLKYVYQDFQFKHNIEQLSKLVGLSAIELDILVFCATVHTNQLLESALNVLGNQSIRNIEKILSICLDYSEKEIRSALLPESVLVRSGLLSIDTTSNNHFTYKLGLLDGLIDQLHTYCNEPEKILKNIVFLSKPAKLTLEKYSQLEDIVNVLLGYLNQVTVDKEHGVNILIYGVPGSGKTEFVRTIADHCNFELYEVASESNSDTPLDINGRFRAYRLGQIMCECKGRPAILFDEVEDVFIEKNPFIKSNSNNSGRKSWVNQLLESNPVPSFWITNNISSIDPAYVRRFDLVIEINSPPRSVREVLLNEYLVDLPVSTEWKKMMSDNETLLPALIERSASVVRKSMLQVKPEKTEKTLEILLGNTIEAMGYSRPIIKNTKSEINYRLDMLNTDFPVESIYEGLKTFGQGRLCLYGPPGTGKTAFGKYLSTALDLPLISKKASDITSPYLGMSEQNMAAMFRQAKEENAILMLDEADTFLSDRKNAQRSWEVSAVNEMLTQMESFEGIFIASTNLMESLDSASIRRFDIKLKFDYMNPEQVYAMFEALILKNNLILDESAKYELKQLTVVTPGDFAVIQRKLKYTKINTTQSIIEMIRQECAFKKNSSSRSIGF